MINKIKSGLIICLLSLLCACDDEQKPVINQSSEAKEGLIKADEEFAAMSEAKGLKEAYLEYIDSNGVILRPDVIPMAGADAVDYIIALKDTGYKMVWKPQDATVAASGELGYTYGVYQLTPQTRDTVLYGTYLNVWKKQEDGKWKFIVQSNNEGIGSDIEPQ